MPCELTVQTSCFGLVYVLSAMDVLKMSEYLKESKLRATSKYITNKKSHICSFSDVKWKVKVQSSFNWMCCWLAGKKTKKQNKQTKKRCGIPPMEQLPLEFSCKRENPNSNANYMVLNPQYSYLKHEVALSWFERE